MQRLASQSSVRHVHLSSSCVDQVCISWFWIKKNCKTMIVKHPAFLPVGRAMKFFLKGPLGSLEKSCPKSLTSIVHNRSCWNKCSLLGNCALGRTPKGNPDDFHIALIEQSVFRSQSYKWHRSSISIYQKANRKQRKVDSWVSEIEIIFYLSPPKHKTPEEHVRGSWEEGKHTPTQSKEET